MSSASPHLGTQWHPVVVNRRLRDLLGAGVGGLLAATLAMGLAVAMPKPNILLVFGLAAGVAAVLVLALSARYELTLTFLAVYLGMLDGPVKLESASQAASGVRDVFIVAVCVGMLLRLAASRQRVRLPPLSAWVLAFVAVVLVEGLNPNTGGILKSLGGYRQELEWVPFFFFGYLIIRSKRRFRQLFLILGVLALANGLVGAVQSRISPGQLATWGPGYRTLVAGEAGGSSGRTYVSEGVARARPPALGSDSGFGGGIGVIALPGLLALLTSGSLRRRWPALLCCTGALLGIATAASRTSIIEAVVALLSYAALSLGAGLRVSRPLGALAAIVVIAIGVGSVLVAVDGKGVFGRQKSLASLQGLENTGGNSKEQTLAEIPHDLANAPFGYGLGTGGSVGGFGGTSHVTLGEKRVKSGSAYNLLTKELGIPGLLLWLGLSANVLLLAATRIRKVKDLELRGYLVAVVAVFAALTAEGVSGATLAVTVGVYLWFAAGLVAYWLGRRAQAVGDLDSIPMADTA